MYVYIAGASSRVWNLGPKKLTKNRPGGWNLTPNKYKDEYRHVVTYKPCKGQVHDDLLIHQVTSLQPWVVVQSISGSVLLF